jgi:thiol-disulfide isomerase/thioredoxin
MNGRVKIIIGIIALAAVIAGAVIAYNALSENYSPDLPFVSPSVPPSEELGQTGEENPQPTAPDFTVLDIDGNEVKLSDFFGQPIVLNFWASWCPPCRAHKPVFDTVYDEMKDDVVFLMVNLTDGRRETVESAFGYIAENGYRFPVYYDTTQNAARAYGITSVPTTFFIDKDGQIAAEHTGQMNEAMLRSSVELIA